MPRFEPGEVGRGQSGHRRGGLQRQPGAPAQLAQPGGDGGDLVRRPGAFGVHGPIEPQLSPWGNFTCL